MKKILTLLLIVAAFQASAQQEEETQVRKVIQQLFDGMRAGDGEMARQAFGPKARLLTAAYQEGKPVLSEITVAQFAEAVDKPHDFVWDERIWSYDIRIDGLLATAWTEYTFYAGEQMSHCGVNSFQLLKGENGWKIIEIIDTRRKENCRTEPLKSDYDRQQVNQFVDEWHKAAAEANLNEYFDAYAEDGIFLGTDASENWTKAEFKAFSKPFFEKGKSWKFVATERNIYYSKDGQYIWFDELLDTWMGTCRGSGVLIREGDSFRIKHYDLTLTVPNEVVSPVIKLICEESGECPDEKKKDVRQ